DGVPTHRDLPPANISHGQAVITRQRMRTMKKKKLQLVWLVIWIVAIVLVQLLMPGYTAAQGTASDYERARKLKAKYEAAAIDIAGAATWIGNTDRFWYRKL